MDVFLESITIVSACNKVFRKTFVQPDTIGIIPIGAYTDNGKESRKAIACLKLEENESKVILRGRNGKERQLPEIRDIYIDGFCEEMRIVSDFMVCYWHGIPAWCSEIRLQHVVATPRPRDTYEHAMYRLGLIGQAGYRVKLQWECEYELPEDVDVESNMPLKIRDARYCGRVSIAGEKTEETIEYMCVMSIYPWVWKYFKFPIGYPTLHLQYADIRAMLAKEVLVWCTVLSPRDTYHLVLPYRFNGRLTFSLCRAFAESGY